jgi:hypothetical protein
MGCLHDERREPLSQPLTRHGAPAELSLSEGRAGRLAAVCSAAPLARSHTSWASWVSALVRGAAAGEHVLICHPISSMFYEKVIDCSAEKMTAMSHRVALLASEALCAQACLREPTIARGPLGTAPVIRVPFGQSAPRSLPYLAEPIDRPPCVSLISTWPDSTEPRKRQNDLQLMLTLPCFGMKEQRLSWLSCKATLMVR